MRRQHHQISGSDVALQNLDIVSSVLKYLSSPRDVLSASGVCRIWRTASLDHAELRSWTLDDTLQFTPGLKASATPLLPKTPPPKQWINPTAHSPLASFKVPRSLLLTHPRSRSYCEPIQVPLNFLKYQEETLDDSKLSPRTPSPIREPVKHPPLYDIVKERMFMGRFLGDVDIMSSRMNDCIMQLLLKNCPRLHTFRLVHTCPIKLADYIVIESFNTTIDEGSLHKTTCFCNPLSDKAFLDIHQYCPELTSVTLILQHVTFRKMLHCLAEQLGKLPKLQTLSLELRPPSFGQSTKSKVIWDSHVRFTDQEIMSLIQSGPPPLHALAINRCDLTGNSIASLARACPQIEALELHSQFEDTKDPGFLNRVPLQLLDLSSLSAIALGTLMNLDDCNFGDWKMSLLKRLRLESREPLTLNHLHQLRSACPELESLHLIWNGAQGVSKEAHIYPFTEESFSTYLDVVEY